MWSPIRQLVEAGVLLRGGSPHATDHPKDESLTAYNERKRIELKARVKVEVGELPIGSKISLRARAQTIALDALRQQRAERPDESTTARETRESKAWPEVYARALLEVGFRRGTDEFNEEMPVSADYPDGEPTLSYDDAAANLDPAIASAASTQADNWYRTLRVDFQGQAKKLGLDPVKDAEAAAVLWADIVTKSVSEKDSGVRRNLLTRGTPSFTVEAADPDADLARATAEEALTTARNLNARDAYWEDPGKSKTAFALLEAAKEALQNSPNFAQEFTARFESITQGLSERAKQQLRGLFGSGGDTAAPAPAAAAATSAGYVPPAVGGAGGYLGVDGVPKGAVLQDPRAPTGRPETPWVPHGAAVTTNLLSEYERIMTGIAQGKLELDEAKAQWTQKTDLWDQERLIRQDQRQQEQFDQQLAISQRTLRLHRDKARLEAGIERQVAVSQGILGATPYLAPRTEFLPGQEPGGAMQRLSEFSGAAYTPVRTADVTQPFDPDAIAEQALREFDARSSDIPTGVG